MLKVQQQMTLKEERRLYKEAQLVAQQFMGRDGVVDVELGYKHKNGKITKDLSIRIRVDKKKDERVLKKKDILPKIFKGFNIDVLESKVKLQNKRVVDNKSLVRPVIGGVQIQSELYNSNTNWGTLGCCLMIENHLLAFTNYHVLFGGSTPQFVADNFVGKLQVYQNLNSANNQIGIVTNLYSQELDYATFALQTSVDQAQSINALNGQLSSYIYPQINMPLVKSGASTGVTYGIIDGRSCIDCSVFSIRVDSNYSNPNNMISDYGDSGSVWLLNDGSEVLKPIALHFGGDELSCAKAKSFASIFASIRNKIHNQTLIL